MKALISFLFLAVLFSSKTYAVDFEPGVKEICKSGKPILVVDDFTFEPHESSQGDVFAKEDRPYVDLDGDGRPDASHGDLVLAICRATGKRCLTYPLPQSLVSRQIVKSFSTVLAKIESGELEQPISINVSATLRLELKEINELGLSTKITPENFAENKAGILKALLKSANRDLYAPLFEIFTKLNERGITLVTAAGNDGTPDVFNYYSLMPGAITVGALNYKGEKAPYTNQNSMATVYRRGDFFGRAVEGGIDINGDNVPEFPSSELTGGEPIVKKYIGKPLKQMVLAVPEYLVGERNMPDFKNWAFGTHAVPEGLYKNSDFSPDGGTAEEKAQQDYIQIPSYLHFTARDGKLVYDPAEDHDPLTVIDWHGTSFAAPNICSIKN